MTNNSILIVIGAVILSFIGGFLLANSLNRGQMDVVRAENDSLKAAAADASKGESELTLTNNEITAKIAEADANPANLEFQKNLGLALYRYAAMKKDMDLLAESVRILARAVSLDPDDRDLQVGLGNAYFDVGYLKKDNENFKRSREIYETAMRSKPDDVEVRTDIALTYFLQEPPDLTMAAAEFEKSLKLKPKHEKSLQFLIQTLIKQNKAGEAAKYLEQLKEINPDNPANQELTALLTQAGNQTQQ